MLLRPVRTLALLLAAALAPLGADDAAAWGMPDPKGQQSLEGLTVDLAGRFRFVGQVIPEQIERLQSHPGNLLLLDVREKDEFAVAHIKGAEWLDPDTTARQAVEQLGARVAGRTVVLYCSVGYRSSKMADRVREALTSVGARRVVNLSGGIFAWHNTGRPLVDSRGATVYVHPYDRKWGRYLDFDNLARMKVE